MRHYTCLSWVFISVCGSGSRLLVSKNYFHRIPFVQDMSEDLKISLLRHINIIQWSYTVPYCFALYHCIVPSRAAPRHAITQHSCAQTKYDRDAAESQPPKTMNATYGQCSTFQSGKMGPELGALNLQRGQTWMKIQRGMRWRSCWASDEPRFWGPRASLRKRAARTREGVTVTCFVFGARQRWS